MPPPILLPVLILSLSLLISRVETQRTMPPWYKRTLPSQEALERATAQLEKARNSQDRRRAQKYCDDAKEALERLDFSKITTDLDQVIAVYREHARMLEKVGLPDEAQLSYSKVEELR